jgi:hypothetical protein
MQTVREAALRPAAAEFYPYLPARMWTAAAHLAERVARYHGMGAKAASRANRVLTQMPTSCFAAEELELR